MRYYGNSLLRALQDVYPNHAWHGWLFTSRPRNYWLRFENQRMFFDWVFKELQLQHMNDWYSVSPKQISKLGGAPLQILQFSFSNVSSWHELPYTRVFCRIFYTSSLPRNEYFHSFNAIVSRARMD